MFEKIKDIRTNKGMTQAELAEACGVSRLAIMNLENGKVKNARSKTLFAISKALGCTIDDLIDDLFFADSD